MDVLVTHQPTRELPGPLARLAVDNQTRLPVALIASEDRISKSTLVQHLLDAGSWTVPGHASAPVPVAAFPGTAGAAVIQAALDGPGPHWDYEWDRTWMKAIAADFGDQLPDPADMTRSLRAVSSMGPVLFVVDGLDVFTGEREGVQCMARSLFTFVLNALQSDAERRVGMLVFEDRATIRWAVPQNSPQLLNRYCEYALD